MTRQVQVPRVTPWVVTLRATFVLGLLVSLTAAILLAVPSPSRADGSSVTVSGTGPFSDLRITVDQTSQLINQVVRVSWTGGEKAPILQIMQCWGDDPDPAKLPRENCQFGGLFAQGQWIATRQVSYAGAVDTNETEQPGLDGQQAFVPFHPVTGDSGVQYGNTNQYFDTNSTNELPINRTYPDGSGEAFFQMQTAREAPGLGCGAQTDDVNTPDVVETEVHRCWLAVVPRADSELPGITSSNASGVVTSPLGVTNWAQHVAVPLDFQSVGTTCPLGVAQVPTYGTELMTDAVISWEAGLCRRTGTVFSFTQIPDDLARTAVTTSLPGDGALAFVGRSIPASQVAAGRSLTYAPLAVSAVGIGFLVEQVTRYGTPVEVSRNDGKRVTDIKLTPRLVAKLLTQSYRAGAMPSDPNVGLSTYDLITDPEFLRLNPSFRPFQMQIGDALMPYIPADSVSLLWEWIKADKDARDFISGKPNTASPLYYDKFTLESQCSNDVRDDRGNPGCPSYVNVAYQGLSLPLTTFPKQDPFCYEESGYTPLCTLDLHPYTNTLSDSALNAARGDSLRRTVFNGYAWTKSLPQTPGSRGLLGVTDTPSAARYGLQMASLRNAAGEFVAPDAESMRLSVRAMRRDSAGVLVPVPNTTAKGAYPLTTVTYAALDRTALSAASRKAYSSFLRYAATYGQEPGIAPGDLPEGYLPIVGLAAVGVDDLSQETLDAAAAVADPVAPAPTITPTPTPTPAPTVTVTATATAEPTSAPSTEQSAQPEPIAPTQPSAAPTPSDSGTGGPPPSPPSTPTPGVQPSSAPMAVTQLVTAGVSGQGPLVALILGAMAAVGAAVALRLSSGGSS